MPLARAGGRVSPGVNGEVQVLCRDEEAEGAYSRLTPIPDSHPACHAFTDSRVRQRRLMSPSPRWVPACLVCGPTCLEVLGVGGVPPAGCCY